MQSIEASLLLPADFQLPAVSSAASTWQGRNHQARGAWRVGALPAGGLDGKMKVLVHCAYASFTKDTYDLM